MKRSWVAVLAIIIFLLLGILTYSFGIKNKTNPTPSPVQNTTPGLPQETVSDKNITVISPKANETIKLPFQIKGTARVFENQFNYRVKEGNTVLAEGFSMTDAKDAGQFGNYVVTISLIAPPKGDKLTIEVFESSPKDGSETNKVSIPVQFDNSNTMNLKVYFADKKSSDNCTKVTALQRITDRTQAPARATLYSLLQGPTKSERDRGFFTSINSGVKIQWLVIENGIARVDFDKTLEEEVGGSCKVSNIRAQITQTLLQFPTVKTVVISIDGRTEDILQP